MPHRLTIQVLDWRGDPLEDVEVKAYVSGWLSGGELEPAYTDASGHAHLETAGDYESSREVRIECKGKEFGPYQIGGGSYTIQV